MEEDNNLQERKKPRVKLGRSKGTDQGRNSGGYGPGGL